MSRRGKTNVGPAEVEAIARLLRTTTLSTTEIGKAMNRHPATVYQINRRHRIRSYISSGSRVAFHLPDGSEQHRVTFDSLIEKSKGGHRLWTGRMNGRYPRWEEGGKMAYAPSPQLIILNEADGPGLRILQYCPVCDETVTDSLFSADDFMSVEAAGMVGDFDAHAWLDHVAARHGGAS